jgi:hypothetical protein
METLIFLIVLVLLVRAGVQAGHEHWQGSKAANRASTRGQSVPKRARSAASHDFGYWLHQVLTLFPQTRHGLAAAWHAGREAQAEGYAARQQAKTGHLETRARVLDEIREHLRRQEEAMERIRAARQPAQGPGDRDDDPVPDEEPAPPQASSPAPQDGEAGENPGEGSPAATSPAASTTEGSTAMPTGTTSGDTTYTQQLDEYQALRRDAEATVNDLRLQRMQNRLDILTTLGLDSASLAEAAAIDDALQALQKAAQAVLDAADAAIHGLETRHGGIQEAVDNSPVAQPAEPEFYQN